MNYKKINTEPLDDFFSFVSKAVIIIPISIFVFSLMFKFGQSKTGLINQKTGLINQAPTEIPIAQNNSIKFDLNGPYHCIYKNNTQNFEAFIKNKNILLKITQNNSEKKYLLTSYVPMIENLFKQDISRLQSMANQYNIDLKKALDSCQKEDIKDSVFK